MAGTPPHSDRRENLFNRNNGVAEPRLEVLFLPLGALASEFPGAANRFRLFPRPPLRGFLVVAAHLHFPENSLALHLLFKCLQRLIDIVFAYDYMNQISASLPQNSGFIPEPAAL